ncbi:MAG: VWA domain-containing protein [bacterium]|nr:VWA domain-containing protein [bacterium]
MTKPAILAAFSGVLITAIVAADEKPTFSVDVNEATFSVDVDVVNIFATVRDRNGRIIKDLTEDDFLLTEDGRLQEIKYFARQTDLPLTVGLLVDTSGSQVNLIDSERRTSYQFFEQVLRPTQDLAFVVKFAGEVELLQELTGSRDDLQRALYLLEGPDHRRRRRPRFVSFQGWPGGGSGWPGSGTSWPGGGRRQPRGQYPIPGGSQRGPTAATAGTALHDSVFLAADEVLRGQDGRKAVILISDGVDTTSMVSQQKAIEAAQKADVIVYSIRYYDPMAYQRGGRNGRGTESRGAATLMSTSNRTGGRMFEARDERSLEKVFHQIQEELRNQYNIGYSPTGGQNTNFRKIKLTAKDKKLKVQTREGYFPKS